MSRSQRYPGVREEGLWLSHEQLGQCVPAEAEPFQSPVPTRMMFKTMAATLRKGPM
jgi:hypothetical protein